MVDEFFSERLFLGDFWVFNPRLTKLFFVTRLTKGVVATP